MVNSMRPAKSELENRIQKTYDALQARGIHWDAAFFVGKVNQYYLTGTMQDAVFVLKRDGSYAYFVRRSLERGREESLIDNVYPMSSYRDVAGKIGGEAVRRIYIEADIMPHSMLERLKKYFPAEQVLPVDALIQKVRSVKSAFELDCIREAARQHNRLMHHVIPGLLKEGMSETEFAAETLREMINMGYQGMARFAMFQTEMIVGQLGFGVNSIYPTNFDGPGGMKAMHPAAPILGDRTRLLRKGDLVFVDIGYGVAGYHSDMTQVYMFGQNPHDEVVKAHRGCMKVQRDTAELLKPGNIPADIYNNIMAGLGEDFLQNFMGYGSGAVKFLGHGVGLCIDESPVIANGFNEPLQENMVIALEPKKGIPHVGMVGVEDTYVVTPRGGECLTGGQSDIIVI